MPFFMPFSQRSLLLFPRSLPTIPAGKKYTDRTNSTPSHERSFWLAAPVDLYRLPRVRAVWNLLREYSEQQPPLFAHTGASAGATHSGAEK